MSLAKNMIFNLCKAFPNASKSPTNIYRLCFTTSASKNPWGGQGVDANSDPKPDMPYEDVKKKAKDYAEEGTNRAAETAWAAKENVKGYAYDAKEKAKEGMNRAAERAEDAKERAKEMAKEGKEKVKESVEGAWEAAKDKTKKMKESVMGGNNTEKKVVDQTDVRTKAGTNFDD